MRGVLFVLSSFLALSLVIAQESGYPLHLTFDDGPNNASTSLVLEVLAKHEIKATFFVVGRVAANNQSILDRIVSEGHQMGNHSWTHPKLTAIGNEQIAWEILQTRKVINGRENGTFYFRPPYGSRNSRVDAIISRQGYISVLWNIDTLDWKFNAAWKGGRGDARFAPDRFVDYVRLQTLAAMKASRYGSVVLMHDSHWYTAQALDGLIVMWQTMGCIFVEHLTYWEKYR